MDDADLVGEDAGSQQPTDDKEAGGTPIFDELLREYQARAQDGDPADSGPDEMVDA